MTFDQEGFSSPIVPEETNAPFPVGGGANEDSFDPSTDAGDAINFQEETVGVKAGDTIEFSPTQAPMNFDPKANYLEEMKGGMQTIDFDPKADYVAEVTGAGGIRATDVIEWDTPEIEIEDINDPRLAVSEEKGVQMAPKIAETEPLAVEEFSQGMDEVRESQERREAQEAGGPTVVETPEMKAEREALEKELMTAQEEFRTETDRTNEERIKAIASANPEKSRSFLEHWETIGAWYNARPLKQKIALSVGLAAAGVGAAAVGAAGAGLAIGGLMVAKRFVGAAGTYAALEAGLASAYAKREERSALHKKIDSLGAATLAVLIGGGAVTAGVTSLLEHGGGEAIDAAKEKVGDAWRGAKENISEKWQQMSDHPRTKQLIGHTPKAVPASAHNIVEAVSETPEPEPVFETFATEPIIPDGEIQDINIDPKTGDVITFEEKAAIETPLAEQAQNSDATRETPSGEQARYAGGPEDSAAESRANHGREDRRPSSWRDRVSGSRSGHSQSYEHAPTHEEISGSPEEIIEKAIAEHPRNYALVEEGITSEMVAKQEVDSFLQARGIPIERLNPRDYERLQVNVFNQFAKEPGAYTLEAEAHMPNANIKTLEPGTHIDRIAVQKLVASEARNIARWQNLGKTAKSALVSGILRGLKS